MVKQRECMFAIWPTCQCIFACQLLYLTSQQASQAQSYFLFYFVVWHTGDKVRRIHLLLGYVHDSSGYKCLRPGSHHQVVSPLSSRVSARCPLVQQLPQYRVVSKSALGSLSLVWRAVGWLGLYQVLCWRTVYHVKSWESRPFEPQMLFLVWASMNAMFEVLKNTTEYVAEMLNLLGDWVSLEIRVSIEQEISIFAWHTLFLTIGSASHFWQTLTAWPYMYDIKGQFSRTVVLPFYLEAKMGRCEAPKANFQKYLGKHYWCILSRACHRKGFCTIFCLSQIIMNCCWCITHWETCKEWQQALCITIEKFAVTFKLTQIYVSARFQDCYIPEQVCDHL